MISGDDTPTTLGMQNDGVVEVRDTSMKSVRVKVISDVYGEHFFDVKIASRMRTLMKNYSESLGAGNCIKICFLFNGRWVKDEDTPASLEMQDDDFLRAFEPPEGRLAETGVHCASTLY